MDKTSKYSHKLINLLPPEFVSQKKQSFKVILARKVSVGVLLFVIFLGSLVLGFRIIQATNLSELEKNTANAQGELKELQTEEELSLLLKKRVDLIRRIENEPKNAEVFNTVVSLLPPNTAISLITVDQGGEMSFSITSNSLSQIEQFINSLLDDSKTAGNIARVEADSITRGKDNLYRFNLKVSNK